MDSFISECLADLGKNELKRDLRYVEGCQGREIVVNGNRLLNFCSNNYLGLADDDRLTKAAIDSIQGQGFGSGASRLVCGSMTAHRELEEKIAQFKGTEKAIVFSTGYMANVGIISSLFNSRDIIFSDRLNHASIIDGIQLSQAKFRRYPHRDMHALEKMLADAEGYEKKVIITDSVFSMDGDIAPLDQIVRLKEKYNCLIMIDEAHALGVLGKNGKGAIEHFDLAGKIDIQMGTFSKAAGAFGAYCCGSEELIDFLVNKARSFIYTTGMPPSVAAAAKAGIEVIENDQERRQQLWENTDFMAGELNRKGFDTLDTETHIIPVLVKESGLAVELSRKLFENGIFVSAIRPPTVPKGTARLRVTVMSTHTQKDLDYFLQQIEKAGKELCII